jgi:tetratricopeptide (TPR) repeat protein
MALNQYPEAIQDLVEMVSIAPDEAQTYLDRALVLDQDPKPLRSLEQISRDIERAIELDPPNPTARFRRALLNIKSTPEGMSSTENYRRAREDLDIALRNSNVFSMARLFRMVCDLALQDSPAFESDLELYVKAIPGLTQEQQDHIRVKIDSLVHAMQQMFKVSPLLSLAAEAARLLMKQDYEKAEEKYREVIRQIEDPKITAAEKLSPEEILRLRIESHYNLACIYSLRKDENHGIEELERALESGYKNFSHILEDPDLEAVRAHPGFQPLIQRYKK